MNKFQIVYADCPWNYNDKANAGKRGAVHKYPCMTLADIKNLPVSTITDDNCVLFMWVTMPFLPKAEEVMNAWSFTYKTCAFTWVKKNKKSGTNFWGMGSYSRGNAELCLLGTKGKLPRLSAGVHSVIDDELEDELLESPIREHSRKPDEARNRIVKLYGDVPRVELFAREVAEGWISWGNEIECEDIFAKEVNNDD